MCTFPCWPQVWRLLLYTYNTPVTAAFPAPRFSLTTTEAANPFPGKEIIQLIDREMKYSRLTNPALFVSTRLGTTGCSHSTERYDARGESYQASATTDSHLAEPATLTEQSIEVAVLSELNRALTNGFPCPILIQAIRPDDRY